MKTMKKKQERSEKIRSLGKEETQKLIQKRIVDVEFRYMPEMDLDKLGIH